ncbi:DNA polymerase III subunit gamma/tau [Altererythrobacter aurantiacus]|uniref:DNA polymerase III subunit gamma/tau n=1 Tax=Parapontixanthobacter aurantiacus TaxID=1463599 RepID=A0A844ZGU8_9SPHN|nr:DNA polymerase III subunit gamma/tau [Parapontixanthobacter aurantiacus]MXO84939.1 DNA polymerase III subunit gamma/tau [Parapontixanthobacter aurantiacus]
MDDSPANAEHDSGGLPWNDDSARGERDDGPSAAELEAAGQNALFAEAEPTPPVPASSPTPAPSPTAATSDVASTATVDPATPYRVLARKYRPQTFSELIGQEPMVRTLANAIKRDRLAHAFLMTGVRGVGKTSTARLIAKALNCMGPDGNGGPTIDPCGVCEPCRAIAEGRHIDVIEMDAASHTGVDDVREIIEAVRYSAVSARYKIYIIDEVHMLSRNAFNALLKTLEEPPAHVKFLFATTEVDKLPVTVLSRTQRFDLRRIPTELLHNHFAWVCAQEGVEADAEALDMIAGAAEGSVRDGLSILDQAIAHADMESDAEGAKVTAERVRTMLGLADKSAQRRLLGTILKGDPAGLLAAIEDQYALGVEPIALIRTLMDLVHRITVAQISGVRADAPSAEESTALTDWAKRLSAGQLHRLWQLLLKGHEEVRQAPEPLTSAQMALLRILHAADLPDPGEMMKRMEELAKRAPAPSTDAPSTGQPGAEASGSNNLEEDWRALIEQVERSGRHHAASVMRLQVRPIALGETTLKFSRDRRYRDDISALLRDALFEVTGNRWTLEQAEKGGLASFVEREQDEAREREAALRDDPLVKAVFAKFPDARFVDEEPGVSGGHNNWSKTA